MKFQTNTCPLCNKVCTLKKIAGVTVFSCPTEAQGLPKPKSHYEVEFDSKTEIQHIILFPFAIDTFGNSSKSRVYHAHNTEDQQKWRLVMEVPVIRAEEESKMLERINKLVTFL